MKSNISKKNSDVFDFVSFFFAWSFLNFLARCVLHNLVKTLKSVWLFSTYFFYSMNTRFIYCFNFFRKPFGNVNRWFTTVVNQPQVKKVVGTIKLAEKMAQFDAKKFAEMQKETGAAGGSGKKENKKEKKEKPAQQPKQEKKKKEATPADEEDEPLVVVPKQKDPMEGVPKGNFFNLQTLQFHLPTYIKF